MIAIKSIKCNETNRVTELLDWERETGRKLPVDPPWIIYWEDKGYIMDLLTGKLFVDVDMESGS